MKTIAGDIQKILILFFSVVLLIASQTLGAQTRTIEYYHTDAYGSVVAATDEVGEVLWRKSYAPYGELQEGSDTSENSGYTGHQHDHDIGLVYMKGRFYDPDSRRFVSMDPVGVLESVESNPKMFNRYAYANNNPYRYIDPDGSEARIVQGQNQKVERFGAGEITSQEFLRELQDEGEAGSAAIPLPAAFAAKIGRLGAKIKSALNRKVTKSGAENVAQFEKLRSSLAAKEIVSADRVGSALTKLDKNHLSASFISESQLAAGKVFPLRGGDGIQRTLLQTKGNLDGKSGVFEFILEKNGTVSHQLFKQGKINGVPTKITK